MTMSGRVQAQTLLQPSSSPEKQRSTGGGECKAGFLLKQEQEQAPPQQQYETMTTTRAAKVRSGPTTDRWEPDEDEVRALAMCDFDVIGVLGVGTYGVVKLAKHVASGASVALKVLSKEQVVSMRQEKHILRERLVHLKLKHAFIARLYGTFQDEDCLYLVIEYLPGGELWSLVYSDFDNNDEDENGEGDSSSETENERQDERVAMAIAGEEAPVVADDDDDDDEQAQCQAIGQQAMSESSGAGDSEKDTEARLSTPTEADEVPNSASSLRPPLLLGHKLTLNLVPADEPGATQQQGEHQPRRRRLSSYTHPPNSPAHHQAMRLDAKSRGLLRNAHGGLKEDHAVFYLACILRALEYLHAQDLLYRDLKLENLVLDRSGYPKVLDFGFAKQNAATGERNMTLCGSMDYMAPEILLHEPHDQRVDIWSFGVIMYELLLGKTPFYHENARELGRKITTEPVVFPSDFESEHPAACDLIAKLLVKAPADRLGSMAELRKHAFFQRQFPDAQAWETLERKERAAPFVPKLAGPFDTSFFQTIDDETQDELNDFAQPYFEDGSHIFRAF